jgi:hypothetical protein
MLIPAQPPADLPEMRIEVDQLPGDWRTINARDVLQALGLRWLKAEQTALLNAPSAIVPAERNPCRQIPACCAISARLRKGTPALGTAVRCLTKA